jgi:hypothetical protein
MKTLFRVSMAIGCLAILFWGGIAAAEEVSTAPESCEYLMKVVGAAPDPSCERYGIPGVADVVACDQMDAAMARAAGCPDPESCEHLMSVVKAYPGWGVADVVASDYQEAAILLAYRGSEAEWGVPAEPMVAEGKLPEIGSYEYSTAMETGSLPSTCGDKPCPPERFTILESGGIPYRPEVDSGGN